jgi:putative ABC transport system substrate-binding protein
MRRREVISLLGGAAAAWPLAARAQPAVPVVGYLGPGTVEGSVAGLAAFRKGLAETGFVEGQNVEIDYRWASGENSRLRELAAALVDRHVTVIMAQGTPSALAAKAATATIPIVFAVAVDPVKVGLVASIKRPGANLTGVTNLNVEVGQKRLELARELLPAATIIGVLLDPTNASLSEEFLEELQPAAHVLGLQLHSLFASTDRDFETAFATLVRLRAGGLVISPNVFFNDRSQQLAALSLRHAIPAIYQYRPFAAAGGLMSYGSDEVEYNRLVGTYAGKLLKGEKPADLPIVQSTKVELIINLKTAKVLGLSVPLPLLGRADEVIE